jgi:hypothetical protein
VALPSEELLPLSEESSSPVWQELFEDFSQIHNLEEEKTIKSGILSDVTARRDAEQALVGARYEPALTLLSNDLDATIEAARNLGSRVTKKAIELHQSGLISDEIIIYVSGLLFHKDHVGSDREEADHDMNRFRQLRPGTKVILANFWGDLSSTRSPIEHIDILGGGILAEPPGLAIPRLIYPNPIDPELIYKFDDQRQAKRKWSESIAIGDDEVFRLSEAWLDQRSDRQPFDSSQLRKLAHDLENLVRAGVEPSLIGSIQTRVLEELESGFKEDPNDSSLIFGLPPINTLDSKLYHSIIDQLVTNPHFSQWDGLERAMTQANEPLWDSLPDPKKRLAQARVALLIAEMRLATASRDNWPTD